MISLDTTLPQDLGQRDNSLPLSRHEQRLANNRASLRRFWDAKTLENESMWAERAALVRDAFARGLTRRQVEAETGWARGTLATVVKRMRAAGEVVKGARVKPKAKLSLTVGAHPFDHRG